MMSTDLLLYGSANMPADDIAPAGGAVDLATAIVFEDLAAQGQVNLVGTDADDVDQDYEVDGIDSAGDPVFESFSLAGFTVVEGLEAYLRIARIAKSAGPALAGCAVFHRAAGTSVDADSPSGSAVLFVADTALFRVGGRVLVAPGVSARQELGTVASIQAGVSITLSAALAHTHTAAAGDAVKPVVAELPGAALAPAAAEITTVKKVFESAASAGSLTVRYEKVFFRNNHASHTLSAAKVRLADSPTRSSPATVVNADSPRGTDELHVASTTGFTVGDIIVVGSGTARSECAEVAAIDPGVSLTLAGGLLFDHTSAQGDAVRIAKLALALADALDDSGSVADRLTTPAGLSFAAAPATLPDGVHPAGSALGVWLRLTLPASDPAFAGALSLEETGQSV